MANHLVISCSGLSYPPADPTDQLPEEPYRMACGNAKLATWRCLVRMHDTNDVSCFNDGMQGIIHWL